MNWAIITPLVVFVVSAGALIARTSGTVLGHRLPMEAAFGLLIGILAGGSVVALNFDIVPDNVELVMTALFGAAAILSLAVLARELTRG